MAFAFLDGDRGLSVENQDRHPLIYSVEGAGTEVFPRLTEQEEVKGEPNFQP